MLSAEKVKHHGMRDERWTSRDKVAQYKGLIGLYARDKIIIENDTNVTRKKQLKELRTLRKEIKERRAELVNSLAGDKQGLRNTLADYRPLQLAFQEMIPVNVVEELKQINHVKRKQYCRLHYKKQQKSQILIDLKLKLAELEDRDKYGIDPPEVKTAQVLLGKVQDAMIKKEVAITIQNNFKSVLVIMKKDALYFDAVLAALKLDSKNQGKCLYRTTQLGQLATEYLDDRQQDYQLLEKAIKKSMKERERTIRMVKEQVKDVNTNLKYLICKESGTELTKKLKPSCSEIELQRNIDSLDAILKFVQDTTSVSAYEDIFPRMEEQVYQKERLAQLLSKYTLYRDTILKKRNHAELMYDTLHNTMADTTFMYKEEKARLLDEIENQHQRANVCNEDIKKMGEIFCTLRSSLQQILEMLKCVNVPGVTIEQIDLFDDDSDMVIVPEKQEEDPAKLLIAITVRLKILMANEISLDKEKKLVAEKRYQALLVDASTRAHEADFNKRADVSLLEGLETEDPTVPTRAEIKKKSAFIVEICTKNDDDIPPPPPRKRKKF